MIRTLRGSFFPLLVVALVTGAAGMARANNGVTLISQSAKGAGRGGATTAVAEDALSPAWNPANLSELESGRFDVSLLWFYERTKQERGGNSESENDFFAFPLPALGFAVDPATPTAEEIKADPSLGDGWGSPWRLGFGLYEPVALVFSPSFLVSYRASDTFSVGVGLHVLTALINYDSTGSVGSGGSVYVPQGLVFVHREPDGTAVDPPRPLTDNTGRQLAWEELFEVVDRFSSTSDSLTSSVDVEIEDMFGVGFAASFGMSLQPHPDVRFGFGVRTPGVMFEPRGKAQVDLTDAIALFDETQLTSGLFRDFAEAFVPNGGAKGYVANYDATADTIYLPPAASLGVAWWPHDRFMLALDLRWIGYDSTVDKLTLELENGDNEDFNEINGGDSLTYELLLNWEDQFVFALGGAFAVTDSFILRAGYNYGNNPVPDETASTSGVVIEHHITLGAGMRFDSGIELDFAYVWGLPKNGEIPAKRTTFAVEQHLLYLGMGITF